MNIYDGRQTPASGTEKWSSGTPGLLVIDQNATASLYRNIGWLNDHYPPNRKEQGGLMFGMLIRDIYGEPVQGEVTHILMAETNCRYPGYIEWDAMEEIRLQQIFFDLKDEMEKKDPEAAKDFVILGWWHTHPNDLPVFMSGTDMGTQRLKYNKPCKYSLVLNPQRGVWKAFVGKEAVEVPAVMLLPGPDGSVNSHLPSKRTKIKNKDRRKLKRLKRKGR